MSSRILGLVRDQTLAFFFGAGHDMDAYNVAFRIPNLLRDLFAEGAMSAAFVPTFTRELTTRGKDAAWRLGNLIINALILSTGSLVVLGMMFAWPLVTFAAEKYAAVPGKLALAVSLARLMFPFLTLVAVAAACMGMLNSLRRFFIPALSPTMFNIGTIGTMLVLIPVLGILGIRPIYAAAIGTLVGGAGQVLVQWPLLHREGYRYRPIVDMRDPGLREVLRLMGPGTLGLAAVQVNLLVNMMLGTREGEGAVSFLTYSFRLMYLPIGIFGVSIATAAIPSLARRAAENDRDAMRATLSNAMRMMIMLNVPATLGLIVLATPIVALLFERGAFTAAHTAGTAAALVFYAPGLVGYSTVKIAAPAFYALRDSRTPVMVSTATMGVNIVLNLLLVRLLGFRGLALGTALASLFNASVLLWLLRRPLGGIDGRRLAGSTARVVAASGAMAAVVWWIDRWLASVVGGGAWHVGLGRLVVDAGLAARVAADIALALITLAGAARLLRIQEFDEALRTMTSRLSGRRATT